MGRKRAAKIQAGNDKMKSRANAKRRKASTQLEGSALVSSDVSAYYRELDRERKGKPLDAVRVDLSKL